MKVAIVGGGVMGLSCAWRLAQQGAAVTLVEARRCGQGASRAALGALWPPSPLATGALQRWHRDCLRGFEEFVCELEAAAGITVAHRRLGRVEILSSPDALPRAQAEAQASDGAMEWIDAPAVRAFARGIEAPFGGLLCRATAQVDVAQLVAALHAACNRAGVHVVEGRAVDDLFPGGLRAGGEVIAADAVLVTAGAWSGKLIGELGIVPSKGQGVALALAAGLQPRGIVKRGPLYVVPWPDKGEVLVGSTTEPEAGFDESVTAAGRNLADAAETLLPALHNAPLLRHWAGLRPDAPRHRPLMGPLPGRPGVWICAGHYKTGIGMCGEAGRLMAAAILHAAPLPQFQG